MADHLLSFDVGTINMAYCRVKIKPLKIDTWGVFSIKDSTNEGSCNKLAEKLDQLKLTTDKDSIIVIEQQPRCNVKTIVISGQLQMYFVLERKMEDASCKIRKIVGYHAKNKIKYYIPRPGDEPWPEKIDKLKKGHYKTKQTLIEHCRRILKHNEESQEWIDFFESSPKRDDLADSYVQALSYIKMNNL